MARPMKPLVRGGGYYPSNRWTPLVYPGGYTTMDGFGSGDEPIEKTVSGSVVSFSDAIAAPLKSLSVAVEPNQNLNGYDNPWPAGGGKNKLNSGFCLNRTAKGLKTVVNADGSIALTGTSDGTKRYWNSSDALGLILPAGTYTLSPSNLTLEKLGGAVSGTFTLSEETTFKNIYWIGFTSGEVVDTVVYPQLELGSTATSYAPYSNICPISGWTECKVTRTGKNLSPYTGLNPTAGSPSTFFFLKKGTYTFSTDTGNVIGSSRGSANIYIQLRDFDNNIITEGNISGNGWSINSSKNFYYGYGGGVVSSATFTLNTDCMFSFGFNNVLPENVNVIQLELGSTATAFEPYQGQTYTIDLNGTRYGGTLDVTQGKLTVDRAMLGNVTWTKHSSYSHVFYAQSGTGQLVNSTTGVSNACVLYGGGNLSSFASNSEYRFRISDRIYINIPSVSNVTDLNTWITNNSLQICYELVTPIVYDLTPTQIEALQGNNTVWADAGDVTVTYLADGNASDAEALGILLGGRYTPSDDVTDKEALDIILGGTK